MSTPRPYTKDEMRQMFLEHVVNIARYWQTVKTDDPFGGMVHSFMVLLDGGSGDMPAFDVTPSPHPEDEEFHKSEGENWWVRTCINDDTQLHEHLNEISGYLLSHERTKSAVRLEFRNKLSGGAPVGTLKHQMDLEDLLIDEIIRLRGGR